MAGRPVEDRAHESISFSVRRVITAYIAVSATGRSPRVHRPKYEMGAPGGRLALGRRWRFLKKLDRVQPLACDLQVENVEPIIVADNVVKLFGLDT